MICIKWHFVPVFGDLYSAVHIFSLLILASLFKKMTMIVFDSHLDFNTKCDQLSLCN